MAERILGYKFEKALGFCTKEAGMFLDSFIDFKSLFKYRQIVACFLLHIILKEDYQACHFYATNQGNNSFSS